MKMEASVDLSARANDRRKIGRSAVKKTFLLIKCRIDDAIEMTVRVLAALARIKYELDSPLCFMRQ